MLMGAESRVHVIIELLVRVRLLIHGRQESSVPMEKCLRRGLSLTCSKSFFGCLSILFKLNSRYLLVYIEENSEIDVGIRLDGIRCRKFAGSLEL